MVWASGSGGVWVMGVRVRAVCFWFDALFWLLDSWLGLRAKTLELGLRFWFWLHVWDVDVDINPDIDVQAHRVLVCC